MAFDQGFAKGMQDHIHGGTALAQPTAPYRLRQMTANGSASANGTELGTAGGYTAGTGAPTIAFGAATTASPSVSTSSSAQTITNMPATTIVGVEIWNSNGTPGRQEWGALAASKTTASGDTLSYAIGAVTSSLA
jgi:hypothetical protein